ncbi:MAG TPA: DUF1801 domain-containing protein [Dokdonella sp.]
MSARTKSTATKTTAAANATRTSASPSRRIGAAIAARGDWRGETLARLRAHRRTVPDVVEEWKWRGVPVWHSDGMLCTGETYASHVKTSFAHGARPDDPSRLLNASLDGGTRRAIDVREGDAIDEAAFVALVRAAAALDASRRR